ncbi:MAG: hypothetical protein WAW91_02830 [Candidatus Nanoperiomorbaceae bacterium]
MSRIRAHLRILGIAAMILAESGLLLLTLNAVRDLYGLALFLEFIFTIITN